MAGNPRNPAMSPHTRPKDLWSCSLTGDRGSWLGGKTELPPKSQPEAPTLQQEAMPVDTQNYTCDAKRPDTLPRVITGVLTGESMESHPDVERMDLTRIPAR